MSDMSEFILSQYFDDQLSPAERDAFEQTLQGDEAQRDDLEDFDSIRGLLRVQNEREVEVADFSNFMLNLEEKLAQEPAPLPAPEPREVSVSTPMQADVWATLRRFFFPALAGAAAALLIMFMLNRPKAEPPQQLARETETVDNEVTIKAVHNQGNQTVLISMPAEDGGATVIWMLDEKEEGEAADPLKGEDPI